MNQNEKNMVDKFLEKYESLNNTPKKVRIYMRPPKYKCIIYFVGSILAFLALIYVFGFHFSVPFIVFLIIDIGIGAFYGYNLFSERGLGLPTYIREDEYDEEPEYVKEPDDTQKNDNEETEHGDEE